MRPDTAGGGPGNNPEQLFAAGYAACFIGAMKAVAAQGGGLKVPADVSVTFAVGIGPRSEGGFSLDRSGGLAARRAARRGRGAGGEGPPRLPLFQRNARGNVDVRLTVV